MTPQEIADYKQQWLSKGGYVVDTHSDLDVAGKDWCRRNIGRHEWTFKPHTAVYQHTFCFESKTHAEQFATHFNAKVST